MALSNCDVPDGNNLAHIQGIVIQLGDEDGSHRLIQCCAIHVNGGTHGEDEAGDPLVDTIVLLGTSEGDGQRGGAARQARLYYSDLMGWHTVVLIYRHEMWSRQ